MAAPFQLTINKRQGQNQYYQEPLAEGVLPLEMMRIPAGTFLMGSPKTELERSPNEGPQHEVSLSQFFMARYPITQAQWHVVAAMPQVNLELKPEPSRFKSARLPVEQVSWHEAVEFCDRLTLHTNRAYRLPTEAEWEYACRAGTTTPFHFGKTITTDVANYQGDYVYGYDYSNVDIDGGPFGGQNRRRTISVNRINVSNALGMSNMHGNIGEWCQDQWHENYIDAPRNGSAWLSGGEPAYRIYRGGSWRHRPGACRSASRFSVMPTYCNSRVGFRVSCSARRT